MNKCSLTGKQCPFTSCGDHCSIHENAMMGYLAEMRHYNSCSNPNCGKGGSN